jgi:hypothetical protein
MGALASDVENGARTQVHKGQGAGGDDADWSREAGSDARIRGGKRRERKCEEEEEE